MFGCVVVCVFCSFRVVVCWFNTGWLCCSVNLCVWCCGCIHQNFRGLVFLVEFAVLCVFEVGEILVLFDL